MLLPNIGDVPKCHIQFPLHGAAWTRVICEDSQEATHPMNLASYCINPYECKVVEMLCGIALPSCNYPNMSKSAIYNSCHFKRCRCSDRILTYLTQSILGTISSKIHIPREICIPYTIIEFPPVLC